MQVLNDQPENPGLPAAKHALMAAQGSDWFWWYGADQDSGDDSQFDALFRTHLRTIYESLGVELPPDLLDLSGNVATPTRPSGGLMEPFYDGLSFPGEWNSAAEYDVGSGGDATDITSIEIGYDTSSIHLKIGVGDIDSYLDPIHTKAEHPTSKFISWHRMQLTTMSLRRTSTRTTGWNL